MVLLLLDLLVPLADAVAAALEAAGCARLARLRTGTETVGAVPRGTLVAGVEAEGSEPFKPALITEVIFRVATCFAPREGREEDVTVGDGTAVDDAVGSDDDDGVTVGGGRSEGLVGAGLEWAKSNKACAACKTSSSEFCGGRRSLRSSSNELREVRGDERPESAPISTSLFSDRSTLLTLFQKSKMMIFSGTR